MGATIPTGRVLAVFNRLVEDLTATPASKLITPRDLPVIAAALTVAAVLDQLDTTIAAKGEN